jgi:glycosyltransferase involved in cell wall biosynthesis
MSSRDERLELERKRVGVIRVGVISPEPTPYRAPLYDRIANEPGIDLTVVYAAATVAARRWRVVPAHRALTLTGISLPLERVLRHRYPLTPSIWPLLSRERFDVVVVAGWSLFAAQAAVLWCRLHRVPYLLTSESHLLDPRARWVAALKRLLLPRVVAPAAGWLVTGSLAADCVVAYGADPRRIRVFANTVDVERVGAIVETARERRADLRASLGFSADDVVVAHVGRLDPVKGADTLVRAVARAGSDVRLLLVGEGSERDALERQAAALGIRAVFAGFQEGDELFELYAAADIFALLSRIEPWGVVVNEAAAAGLPLVLSSSVGAAADLLRDGENGMLVPVDGEVAAAAAFRRLADDPELRARYGLCARSVVSEWGYPQSVAAFVEAVREAASR